MKIYLIPQLPQPTSLDPATLNTTNSIFVHSSSPHLHSIPKENTSKIPYDRLPNPHVLLCGSVSVDDDDSSSSADAERIEEDEEEDEEDDLGLLGMIPFGPTSDADTGMSVSPNALLP